MLMHPITNDATGNSATTAIQATISRLTFNALYNDQLMTVTNGSGGT